MKPYFNLRADFMYVIPTIGYGFPREDTQWLSILWLGMEAGIAWGEMK